VHQRIIALQNTNAGCSMPRATALQHTAHDCGVQWAASSPHCRARHGCRVQHANQWQRATANGNAYVLQRGGALALLVASTLQLRQLRPELRRPRLLRRLGLSGCDERLPRLAQLACQPAVHGRPQSGPQRGTHSGTDWEFVAITKAAL
jgi:hypothetical protein